MFQYSVSPHTVDSSVVMPSRAARRLASVLFPVPLVPHSSTATLLRCSRILGAHRDQPTDSSTSMTSAQQHTHGLELEASLHHNTGRAEDGAAIR